MGPAGSAVTWDVLVFQIGQVVGTVDVVPDVLLWQIHGCEWLTWVFGATITFVGPAGRLWVDVLESVGSEKKQC